MKKLYESPEAEIEKFLLSSKDLITTSGLGDGDTEEELDW